MKEEEKEVEEEVEEKGGCSGPPATGRHGSINYLPQINEIKIQRSAARERR